MGEITQSILTLNKISTYLFMHLYIQPIGHLVILRKKKMAVLDFAIVKTIPKFTLIQISSAQRHADLKTFTGLEELLEFKRAQQLFFFLFYFIYIVLCQIYKEQP